MGSKSDTSLRKFALNLICKLGNELFLSFKGFFSDITCLTKAYVISRSLPDFGISPVWVVVCLGVCICIKLCEQRSDWRGHVETLPCWWCSTQFVDTLHMKGAKMHERAAISGDQGYSRAWFFWLLNSDFSSLRFQPAYFFSFLNLSYSITASSLFLIYLLAQNLANFPG